MSKTVGTILLVAAVIIAVAVPIIGPTALAAWGLSTTAIAAISAGISAGMMVNSLLMAKGSADALKARQASATTLQLGEVARILGVGEMAVAGSLVDAANWGGTYGTDWEGQIRALLDHKCAGLTGFFVNDTFVAYTGDGVVPGYNSQLEVYFRDGSWDQTVPAIVTSNFPGWTANDRGRSVAWVVFAYKADKPDAKNPVWPGGRPSFLPVVKGKLCYDPRKDSTVAGGSGPHRWTDPTTWEWTDNPIVSRFNWARGIYAGDQVGSPDMLLIGRGLTEAEQPPANVAAPANLCDELSGGEPQFRADGLINATDKYGDTEDRFAAAVAGVIVTREGAVEIEPAQAKAPSFAFTDEDLLTGSTVSWNEGFLSEADDQWVNTVIPRYVEPSQKWQDHAAPVRRDTADVTADGGPREETLGLDMVRRAAQAGLAGEVHRRLGRIWGRGAVALGPRFAEIEEGDWGTWTSARYFGGATKTFRVEQYGIDGKWRLAPQLREIAASAFDPVTPLTDGSGSFAANPAPTLSAPPAGDWVLTATAVQGLDGLIPALELAGAASTSAVSGVLFEHRAYSVGLGDDDDWISDGVEQPGTTSKFITQVGSGIDYQVSVSYIVSGEYSPRRILGPVTTGASSYTTSLIANSGVVGLSFSIATNGDITISNHQRVYADKTVNVTGATVTHASGAVAGDIEDVYYDDPTRAGGAVTYQVLRLPGGAGDASSAYPTPTNPFRHFTCGGHVPATGTTSGGSDVGSGGGTSGFGSDRGTP